MGRRGESFAMSDFISAINRDKLTKACKRGRLFDALRMLEELGNARFRKTRKWTPLFVAVDRGFHSLVEVLLRFEHEAWDLEKAYGGALRRHRNDLAGLILRSPSWRAPIDSVEAFVTGDCDLIRAMIASGTDFTAPLSWRVPASGARGELWNASPRPGSESPRCGTSFRSQW
jgi:hypothetical protein